MLDYVREGASYEAFRLSHGELYEGESPNRLNLTYAALVAETIVQTIVGWAKYKFCQWTDHDLVDESSFGPDSGTECLRCRRCGWSWDHTYY